MLGFAALCPAYEDQRQRAGHIVGPALCLVLAIPFPWLVTRQLNRLTRIDDDLARAAETVQRADEEAVKGSCQISASNEAIEHLARNVEDAAEVISKLKSGSLSVAKVLDVIRAIAEQTNPLALNGAIEAAHANKQGHGFAVVADEVRTLASLTQESITDIQANSNDFRRVRSRRNRSRTKGAAICRKARTK